MFSAVRIDCASTFCAVYGQINQRRILSAVFTFLLYFAGREYESITHLNNFAVFRHLNQVIDEHIKFVRRSLSFILCIIISRASRFIDSETPAYLYLFLQLFFPHYLW